MAKILAAVLTLAALAWAADLYRTFGLLLINEQFNAFMLAIALALVFLTYRVRKHGPARVPWYDIAAAVIGMVAALYVAYDYRALSDAIAFRPLHGVIIGSILLVLVFEGLRRSSGNVLAGILIIFIAYGFLGWLLPGEFQGRHVSPDGLLIYLALDVNGVFGSVFGVACTVVVSFLFFGSLLARSGGANFFTDLAIAAFGQLPRRRRQDRDHRLLAVRHHFRQRRLQRGVDRDRHHPDDEEVRLQGARCRRHRGGGLDRRPAHAADHGRGRLHHGRAAGAAL